MLWFWRSLVQTRDANAEAFAVLVRTLRHERKLTQAELASGAGTSFFTISRAEQGLSSWKASTALAVLKALDLAVPVPDQTAAQYLRLRGIPLERWLRVCGREVAA